MLNDTVQRNVSVSKSIVNHVAALKREELRDAVRAYRKVHTAEEAFAFIAILRLRRQLLN